MNKKTVAVQPGANHRWVAGADRGSANQGRSSQPNFLTIKDQRVTRFEFNRENYNYILDQLSSALESKKFSSFSHSTAAALLYHCGRSKCTRFPEGLIPLVVRSISFSNDDNGAKSIGNAVYGLQNLDGFHETTRTLVAALAAKVRESGATLDAQAIGNAVYGLQNLDGAHTSTHALVAALAAKVAASRDVLSAQEIGNAVYGLKNLDGAEPSTHALVAALAEKVGTSGDTLSAQAIGNAVYGLQNLDGSHRSTHALVAALAVKVAASRAELDTQAIGNAVYGLQNLDGSEPSTRILVVALAVKVRDSGATLDAQAIGNAVYGLQNLDGSHRSTHALVAALAVKVRDSGAELDAQAIGNAVYGLQNLAGSHETTHALVAALSSRITGKETCSWGDISNRIVHVSTGNVDKSVAHAELLACEDKNPTLFREPLGVESLIETGRLYHQWGVETESDRPCLVTLDLHHHVPGSIAPYLDFVLNHDDCFLSGYDRYALVVGKGLHSQHYESELKHAVVSYFQSSEWTVQIDTRNSGVVLVSRVAA